MSYYESLDVVSMVVGATIARYDVVHINGGTRLIKPVTDVDAEGICGIAQEGGVIGDTIAMAIAGVSKVVCGDEVTRGAQIGSNTTGKVLDLVTGTRMIGIALASGVENDVIPAIVYVGEKKAADVVA